MDEKEKHTPGPWAWDSVEIEPGDFPYLGILRAVSVPVLDTISGVPYVPCPGSGVLWADRLGDGNNYIRCGEEDAKLIAAAPDLLAALTECEAAISALIKEKPMMAAKLAGSTTLGNHAAEARAVIAKVKGN